MGIVWRFERLTRGSLVAIQFMIMEQNGHARAYAHISFYKTHSYEQYYGSKYHFHTANRTKTIAYQSTNSMEII